MENIFNPNKSPATTVIEGIPSRSKRKKGKPVMSQDIVLSLFDYTGIMVKPWAQAGFLCYCVDIRHPAGEQREGNIVRIGADIRTWLPPQGNVKIVFAFPPCTDVAVSGRAWFRNKGLGKLIEALELFHMTVRLAEWTKAPYMIENPVSTVSTYWRKPDFIFDPCDFGGYLNPPADAYTKRTCLWTGNGFVMPKHKAVVPVEGSRMHRMGQSADRAHHRSITPKGFARAVFEANTDGFLKNLSQLGKIKGAR
ncbi:MAG TPA: Dcm methylase [Verrucomicrobiae bacterium]|nr:Dcm methylase [Verrucomicrobiae bacterium]